MYILCVEDIDAVSGGKSVLEAFASDIAGIGGLVLDGLKLIGEAVYATDKAMAEIGLQDQFREALAGGNLGA